MLDKLIKEAQLFLTWIFFYVYFSQNAPNVCNKILSWDKQSSNKFVVIIKTFYCITEANKNWI